MKRETARDEKSFQALLHIMFTRMLKHLSRSTYKIQFTPCDDAKCTINCSDRKKRPTPVFVQAMERLGGRIPGVCPSPSLPDHNATLIDYFLNKDLGMPHRGTD